MHVPSNAPRPIAAGGFDLRRTRKPSDCRAVAGAWMRPRSLQVERLPVVGTR